MNAMLIDLCKTQTLLIVENYKPILLMHIAPPHFNKLINKLEE